MTQRQPLTLIIFALALVAVAGTSTAQTADSQAQHVFTPMASPRASLQRCFFKPFATSSAK